MALQVNILSPSKKLFTGDADEVIAPAVNGEVGILPQHADYMTLLEAGRLAIRQGGTAQEFKITGGLCTVAHDKVTVLVDGVQE